MVTYIVYELLNIAVVIGYRSCMCDIFQVDFEKFILGEFHVS